MSCGYCGYRQPNLWVRENGHSIETGRELSLDMKAIIYTNPTISELSFGDTGW